MGIDPCLYRNPDYFVTSSRILCYTDEWEINIDTNQEHSTLTINAVREAKSI